MPRGAGPPTTAVDGLALAGGLCWVVSASCHPPGDDLVHLRQQYARYHPEEGATLGSNGPARLDLSYSWSAVLSDSLTCNEA